MPVLSVDAMQALDQPAPRASGTLESHYAPNAKVRLMDARAMQTALDLLGRDVDGKGDLNGTDDVDDVDDADDVDDVDGTGGARGNSEGISVDVSISVSVGNDDSEGDGDDDGEGEGDLSGTDDADSARSGIDDDGEGRGDSFIFISANLSSDFFVFIGVDGLDS